MHYHATLFMPLCDCVVFSMHLCHRMMFSVACVLSHGILRVPASSRGVCVYLYHHGVQCTPVSSPSVLCAPVSSHDVAFSMHLHHQVLFPVHLCRHAAFSVYLRHLMAFSMQQCHHGAFSTHLCHHGALSVHLRHLLAFSVDLCHHVAFVCLPWCMDASLFDKDTLQCWINAYPMTSS